MVVMMRVLSWVVSIVVVVWSRPGVWASVLQILWIVGVRGGFSPVLREVEPVVDPAGQRVGRVFVLGLLRSLHDICRCHVELAEQPPVTLVEPVTVGCVW
ncbi:hypothetical protein COO72_02450 [Bifidobacterium callitrichos]|nr:hypothetical protein COO72_02450 [Bifidobacterium callitrichos]